MTGTARSSERGEGGGRYHRGGPPRGRDPCRALQGWNPSFLLRGARGAGPRRDGTPPRRGPLRAGILQEAPEAAAVRGERHPGVGPPPACIMPGRPNRCCKLGSSAPCTVTPSVLQVIRNNLMTPPLHPPSDTCPPLSIPLLTPPAPLLTPIPCYTAGGHRQHDEPGAHVGGQQAAGRQDELARHGQEPRARHCSALFQARPGGSPFLEGWVWWMCGQDRSKACGGLRGPHRTTWSQQMWW